MAEVTWTSGADDPGFVRFGVGDDEIGQVSAEDLGQGARRALVVGWPAESEVWFQVGDGDALGEKHTLQTGDAPSWIPDLEQSTGDPMPGFLLMGSDPFDGDGGPIILNGDGAPVWWFQTEEQGDSVPTRATMSPDGESIEYLCFPVLTSEDPSAMTGLISVSLDGSTYETLDLDRAHHDFWRHEDGSLVYIAFDAREIDGRTIYGDKLMLRAPSGEEEIIWSTWDDFVFIDGESPEHPPSHWTSTNTFEYDPIQDIYWISIKNLETLVKIDRTTGQLLASIGAQEEMSLDDPFYGQHGFDLLDDGLVIFDNGSAGRADSRALRLEIDETAPSASIAWEWHADPILYSPYQGDTLQLPSGEVSIVWGTLGRIERVDPDTGVLVQTLQYTNDTIFTFTRYLEQLVD